MTDRTVVYRLRADAQQFQAQMKAAGASVRKAADDMTAANKEGAKFRSGLDSLGGAAGKVGLVAAAGLGAAVIKAANFDKAMSNVQAATHESASAMDSLRQAALDAGAKTAFSATEAAAGIENLAKAGVSTADILNGGLSGALDLAAAGEMEVADAAEAAAGAMAQFGLEGSQVPHIADLMAAAAGKAQGEVSDMVMALKQGGTVAAQTGLSIEETTGALAAMAEQSLLGSDAGTSFKTMLSSLTPNSNKAAQAMEQYNIHAFDAQGNFVGMTELAGQLRDGLSGLTAEQRAMALETIFGSDAVRAASIIYDNGAEGVQNWIDKVNDAGFAAETAAIKQDNLRGDLEKLGGALETALIGTGSGGQGPLRDLTQGLTSVVDAYNNLPGAAKTATGAIMGGAALIGGSIWVGSKLVQGISNTREALDNLGIDAGKATRAMKLLSGAGLALAGLAAASAGIKALQDTVVETLPGLEQLKSDLLDLSATGNANALSEEFDSLGESLARLNDPGFADRFSDNMLALSSLGSLDSRSVREAKTEIEALDAALAGLVASAGPQAAADAFLSLYESGALTASELRDLGEMLPQYNDALAGAANETRIASEESRGNADATNEQSSAMDRAAQAAENFKNTLDGLNGVLDGRGDMRDYQAAIDDFTDSLKKNGRTFDINTEKGRNNQAALDNIAGSALAVAENLDTAARKKFLTNAIQDIRTMAKNMGLPKSEVQRLIALLEKANNTNVNPNIDASTGPAMDKIAALEARLRAIKDEDVFVNVRHREYGRNSLGPVDGNAAGGYISGPGTGTSDSIPAYLSNGEYVIKAAAVEKYGVHMFDRLNAMHFASGGSVDDKKRRRRGLDPVANEETEEERRRREQRELREEQRAEDRHTAELERIDAERERIEEAKRAEEERQAWERQIADATLEGQQRAWDQASDAAQAQVDAAKAMVDSVQANMDRIGQAATSAFGGSWFSGNQQHGLWVGPGGGGSGNWRSSAMSDIAGLQERAGIISQLSGLGLKGAALEDLLGNQSNAGIQAMIQGGEIDDFAALFAQRAGLMQQVQGLAGQAGFGADMAVANAHLAQMNARFAAVAAAIQSARPITVLQQTTEQAAAMELARILSRAGMQ